MEKIQRGFSLQSLGARNRNSLKPANWEKDRLPSTHGNCVGTKYSESWRDRKATGNQGSYLSMSYLPLPIPRSIPPHFLPSFPPLLPLFPFSLFLLPSQPPSFRSLRVSPLRFPQGSTTFSLPYKLVSSAGSQVHAFTSPGDTRASTLARVVPLP